MKAEARISNFDATGATFVTASAHGVRFLLTPDKIWAMEHCCNTGDTKVRSQWFYCGVCGHPLTAVGSTEYNHGSRAWDIVANRFENQANMNPLTAMLAAFDFLEEVKTLWA